MEGTCVPQLKAFAFVLISPTGNAGCCIPCVPHKLQSSRRFLSPIFGFIERVHKDNLPCLIFVPIRYSVSGALDA